jgi:CRP-like cAMP-binding protein
MDRLLQSNAQNRIIRLLDATVFAALYPHLEPVDLPRHFVLAEPDKPDFYCYFPETGIGSILAVSPEGQKVEVGIFGRDGVSPIAAVLDAKTSSFEIFMQVGGAGHRIESARLVALMDAHVSLRKLLTRYAQALWTQVAYTAMSNAIHHIEERLARWLLMCHDRMDGNEMLLTHDFLSIMLAVRRPSVTTALHVLEGNGFIQAERGRITVRNRAALEVFANDAYGTPEREYVRLVGPL